MRSSSSATMPPPAMIICPELDLRSVNRTCGTLLVPLHSAVPLHDAAGRVVGALAVVTDQTALRRTGDAPPDKHGHAAPECRTCLVR